MNQTDLVLTSEAINHIENNGVPLIAKDFIGYLIPIDKPKYLFMAIELTGNFWFYRCTQKKNLKITKRLQEKTLKQLIKLNFIQHRENIIFPEFEPSIHLNVSKATYIEGPAFSMEDDMDFYDVEDIKLI